MAIVTTATNIEAIATDILTDVSQRSSIVKADPVVSACRTILAATTDDAGAADIRGSLLAIIAEAEASGANLGSASEAVVAKAGVVDAMLDVLSYAS